MGVINSDGSLVGVVVNVSQNFSEVMSLLNVLNRVNVVVNEPFPLVLVVTDVDPINCCPSPLPDASQAAFEKNSRRKVVSAVLLSVPEIVTLPAATGADVMIG